MSVRRRTWTHNGRERSAWQASVAVDGRQVRRQFSTRREAADWERETLRNPPARAAVNPTVEEAAETWLAACERGRGGRGPLLPHTLRGYRQHVDDHIVPLIGMRHLSDLRGPDIYAFFSELQARLQQVTARKVFKSLRSILREAQAQGFIVHDPSVGIRLASSHRDRDETQIPDKTVIRDLIAAAHRLAQSGDQRRLKAWRRYLPLILTAIFAGLRASELRALRWCDVDLGKKAIRVRQRADEKGLIGPPKSAAGRRSISIPSQLIAAFEAWKPHCPPSDLDLVFPNGQGGVEAHANIINRCWWPLQDEAGVRPRLKFHALRHYFVSAHIAAGASALQVMREAGHSSIRVTYDIYGHLIEEEDHEHRRRIEQAGCELISENALQSEHAD
jgi:integrase